MEILIFDTETTGLLKPAPASLDKQPYIIEIYACVIDQNFQLLREYETFIKPPIPLPEKIIEITNIVDDMLTDAPTFAEIYKDLAKFFTGVDAAVAHNYGFDEGVIACELERLGKLKRFPWPRHGICTVERSMPLKGHRLKLAHLHQLVTGKGFTEGAHRAKADVHALVRSFHGMVEHNLINLEDYEE